MPSQLQPLSCQASAPVFAARSGSQLLPPRRGDAGQILALAEGAAHATCTQQPCSKGAGRCWSLWIQVSFAGAVEASLYLRPEESAGDFPASRWGTQARCWQGEHRRRQIVGRYEDRTAEPDAFKDFGTQKTSTWLCICGATRRGIRDL